MSNQLELLLRRAGRALADFQVAYLFKVPESLQQTPCDFFGYTAKGTAILLEAKMVERSALPMADKPGLLPHQFYELASAERAGAAAFVAWARGERVCVIPMSWIVKYRHDNPDRKSIAWRHLPELWMRPLRGPRAHLTVLDAFFPLP